MSPPVICTGFGGGIRNDVAALDTFSLASSSSQKPVWVRVNVSGSRPRPKYGHTSTTLPQEIFGNALGLLGGVQYGSYQGDVGDFSVLEIDLPSPPGPPAGGEEDDKGATEAMMMDEEKEAEEAEAEAEAGAGAGAAAGGAEEGEGEEDGRELELSGRWVEYSTEGECEGRAYQGVTVADIGGAKVRKRILFAPCIIQKV